MWGFSSIELTRINHSALALSLNIKPTHRQKYTHLRLNQAMQFHPAWKLDKIIRRFSTIHISSISPLLLQRFLTFLCLCFLLCGLRSGRAWRVVKWQHAVQREVAWVEKASIHLSRRNTMRSLLSTGGWWVSRVAVFLSRLLMFGGVIEEVERFLVSLLSSAGLLSFGSILSFSLSLHQLSCIICNTL